MNRITRRQFLLGTGALVACGVGAAAGLGGSRWWERPPEGADEVAPVKPPTRWSVEARYYASFSSEGSLNCAACHGTTEEPLPVSYCHIPHTGTYVQCNLCPHRCIIADGERGRCRVRENRGGRLYSMVYGNPCAVHIDPIEKKPFYHYLPTAAAFSIATAGCNLRCQYCFPPTTPVLTEQGIYTLENLFEQGEGRETRSDGEISYPQKLRVLGADGHYHSLRAAFRHPYTGPLTVIKPYYLPQLRCTPNHRLLATTDPDSGLVKAIEARYLTHQHFLVVPKAIFNEDHEQETAAKLDVAAVLEDYQGIYSTPHRPSPEDVEFIIQSLADGSTSREVGEALGKHPACIRNVASQVRRGLWTESKPVQVFIENGCVRFSNERPPGIPACLLLNERLARLLGYFCAEGCVVEDSNRPNARALYFSFGHAEKPTALEVRRLLQQVLGVRTRLDKTETTWRVGVHKLSAAVLFERLCGHSSRDKRVPEFLFHARPELVKAFLDAYVDGDGHRYANGKISVTTVSWQMAYGLGGLLLRLGLLPSVYCNSQPSRRTIGGRESRQATEQYTVVWYPAPTVPRCYCEDANHFYIPIRRIDEVPFSGFVYNLEVEEEHSYLAGLMAVENCQNWQISQFPPEDTQNTDLPPEAVVRYAQQYDAPVIAYTYSEPTIFYEYMLATARLAREAGLRNVVISAGFINPEPLRELCAAVDAIKIDLKGYDEGFYWEVCGAELKPTLEAIRTIYEAGIHLEIVNLVVPTLNDSLDQLRALARWVARDLSPDVPLHFSRFYPQYKLTHLPPTPVETLERAWEIAREEGVKFAYIGNVPAHAANHTYCSACGQTLIVRQGFAVTEYHLDGGACVYCGEPIPGVWWSGEPAGQPVQVPPGPPDQ